MRRNAVRTRAPRRARSFRAIAALTGACLALPAAAIATDPAAIAPPPVQTRPAAGFDGKSFSGIRFTTDAQRGGLLLGSRSASAWRDGQAQRALLTGDVKITISGRQFTADRAVVWIETTPAAAWADARDEAGSGDVAPDAPRSQVAVFAENIRDPASAPDRAVRADRLLLTAVVVGPVSLRTDLMSRARPDDPFLTQAEERLARYLRDTVSPPVAEAEKPIRSRPPPWTIPGTTRDATRRTAAAPTLRDPVLSIDGQTTAPISPRATGEPGRSPVMTPDAQAPGVSREQADTRANVAPQDPDLGPAVITAPEPPSSGTVSFFAPTREFISGVGEGESAVALSDGVAVQYLEASTGRTLQLTAESAVVFLARSGLKELADAGRGLSTDDVRGVYLEGNVVMSDGRYSIRSPRVFADVRTQRAIFLDAVFWAYDQGRGSALYVRADAIRIETENQFAANNVRVSNSAFFEPALALGATSVTITRTPAQPRDQFFVDAKGGSLLVGGSPALPLGQYRGDVSDSLALQSLDIGSRDGRTLVRTRWDAFNLLGLERVEGLTVDLLADGYFGRGPAFGADATWDAPDLRGSLLGYYFRDNGTDRLSTGARIPRDNDNRGMILFENLVRLDERWDLFTEASYVSDPAFVDALFRSLAKERREFTSSVYLRRRDEASVLSLEARGSFNDFTPNEYLLQSQGHQVSRLPEGTYTRVADPLFGGALYWTQETSASRVALRFNQPPVRDFGFNTPTLAQEAFGINPNQSLADRLAALGLTQENALRFDTRHTLSAPLKLGEFNLTPFGVGRFTAYDRDFDAFAGRDEDAHRLYGGGGARFATALERIDNSVESRLFDLRRMRHVIEPSATVFFAESTRDARTLPVFDRNVELLAEGPVARGGLTNTWQTYRGKPGDEHIVDWLTLRTDYVHGFRRSQFTSPIGRWIENRPEISNLGRFFETEGAMQLTDALALSTRNVYDVDSARLSYISGGAIIDHGEGFSTFADVRHIEARNTLKTDFGVRYALSRQYAFIATTTVDFEASRFESFLLQVERRFEQFSVGFTFARDAISDTTSFGFAFRPVGLNEKSRTRLLTPFGSSDVERLGEYPIGTQDLKPFRTTGTTWGR